MVLPETIESRLLLGGAVLRSLGQPDHQISEVAEQFWRGDLEEGSERDRLGREKLSHGSNAGEKLLPTPK